MAENLFGIDDEFSDAQTANDFLFNDEDPAKLEEIKAKEKREKEEKEKKEAEAKKLAEAEAKKKAVPKKEDTPADDDKSPVDDVNGLLFGDEEKKKEAATDEPPVEGGEEGEEEEEEEGNQFEIISKTLYKAGVFTPEIDEDGEEITPVAKTPEEFKRLFEVQKQTGMFAMLDNHLSRFGEDRLELFDAIFNKGVEPKEYLPVYNEMQDFENISLDIESNQEKVVAEAYRRSGIPEDKIPKRIQMLKDMAELQSEAEDMREVIVNQDKKALQEQEAKKEIENKNKEALDVQYKASIAKILTEKLKEKDFDGIPLNQQSAQKTFDYLYNKKWAGQNGKKYTDFEKFILELDKPENHALKVKVGLLAQQQFDLTKVQKKAVSTESSELFKELASKKKKQDGKKKETATTSWDL